MIHGIEAEQRLGHLELEWCLCSTSASTPIPNELVITTRRDVVMTCACPFPHAIQLLASLGTASFDTKDELGASRSTRKKKNHRIGRADLNDHKVCLIASDCGSTTAMGAGGDASGAAAADGGGGVVVCRHEDGIQFVKGIPQRRSALQTAYHNESQNWQDMHSCTCEIHASTSRS